uniref:DUF632 domain-containing protein n=1 Tax=Ananas comosus var. bracteatus TaxID=296719 RepID=A0A6V7PG95_ANACO|nr:unnamed protein product [Ananas comosus var. bracteatus]
MGLQQSKNVDAVEAVALCRERKQFMGAAVAARNAFAAAHSAYAVALKSTGAALSDYAHHDHDHDHGHDHDHDHDHDVLLPRHDTSGVSAATATVASTSALSAPLPSFAAMALPTKTALPLPRRPSPLPRRPCCRHCSAPPACRVISRSRRPGRRRRRRSQPTPPLARKNMMITMSRMAATTITTTTMTTTRGRNIRNAATMRLVLDCEPNLRCFLHQRRRRPTSLSYCSRRLRCGCFCGLRRKQLRRWRRRWHRPREWRRGTTFSARRIQIRFPPRPSPSPHGLTAVGPQRQISHQTTAFARNATAAHARKDDHRTASAEKAGADHPESREREEYRVSDRNGDSNDDDDDSDDSGGEFGAGSDEAEARHIDHSAIIMRVITWNRSFKGLPQQDDARDNFDTEELETHASVLDKMLAWEKKLYDEAKEGELMKIEYHRKAALLNQQRKRGVRPEVLERSKFAVVYMQTRCSVDRESMNSTVAEINRLRDHQLYPKLVDLVEGMAKMWEVMFEHHRSQLRAITECRAFDFALAPRETSEQHRQRTAQLRDSAREWHSSFEGLFTHQKDYIRSLNSWLSLNLVPIENGRKEKDSSLSREADPPIEILLQAWHQYLDVLPHDLAKNAMHGFAEVMSALLALQDDELKLKSECEDARKDLERKRWQFEDWHRKHAERRGLCLHWRALKVRERSIGSLRTHLPELFRAMSDFAFASCQMYKRLWSITQFKGQGGG